MANIRVKDLDSKASFASDDEILMDSPSGTGTMLRDAFISAVASQIVAAPSTYKIATLDGANKLTSSQDPSQSVSYLGGHDMVANSPALADGSGTAGDTYYVTNPGTRNYGSGNITAQEGDALVYSGSVWQLVEGIANILDGISTASTARTTLEVNSKDEDAQANALKTTAPSMYFNGTSSVVTVADDPKLSFTDLTNDLPFSISAWINMTDASSFGIVTKYATSGQYEWAFWVDGSDKLVFRLTENTDIGDYSQIKSDATVTAYEGQWIHVACSYAGAGPTASSGNDFSAAASGMALYVNGSAIAATGSNVDYPGMTAGSDPVTIGKILGSFAEGSIRDVKIFNREITSTEVAELARGNDLGFSEEWAGALGAVYTSDFTSDSTDSWAASNGAVDATSTVGGDTDNLQFTSNTSTSTHFINRNVSLVTGKRYRLELEYYIPSGQSNIDGVRLGEGGGTLIGSVSSVTDAWTRIEAEFVASNVNIYVFAYDGASNTFTDAGGDDTFAIRNVKVTEIGTLADFRSEDYNESASKLLDRSSNNFVGVGTSVTLTGNQRHISADTIDLKNLPTSSAGLSAGEVWSNGGVLTVV